MWLSHSRVPPQGPGFWVPPQGLGPTFPVRLILHVENNASSKATNSRIFLLIFILYFVGNDFLKK